MAGEVGTVQQEQAATPAPAVSSAASSQDVAMTDAQTAAKAEDSSKPADPEPSASTAISDAAIEPKDTAPEPVRAPEAPMTEGPEPEALKAEKAAASVANLVPVPGVSAEITAEKTDDGKAQLSETPAPQSAEDGAKKAEAAEDAAAKMLASNLDSPVNGKPDAVVESQQPAPRTESQTELQIESQPDTSPVAGEKRKAEDDAEANGDTNAKKAHVKATPAAATNGTPSPRKAGRPKKDKKAPAPVGKTARRTRSQGAAEI